MSEVKEKDVDTLFDGMATLLTNKEATPVFVLTVLIQLFQTIVNRNVLPKEDVKQILLAGMDAIKQQERMENELMGITAKELLKDENQNLNLQGLENKIYNAIIDSYEVEREKIKEKIRRKAEEEKNG